MTKNQEYYALSNPISVAVGKESQDFTRDDLLKVIKEKNIERITFHYTGIDGKIKELKIPVANRRQAEIILTEGERVDGSSLFKGMVDAGHSDLYVVPVYKSAFLNPFVSGSLDFVCRFIDADGNLAPFAPDNILHKATELLKSKSGLELHALGELEFFLLRPNDSRLYPLPKQKGYHASAPFAKSGVVLNEMLRYITQISGSVKYAHHEVGALDAIESDYDELYGRSAEQVEIEFLPQPIEEAADSLVLARWIIRNVAYRNGNVATFVPKLEIGHAGNGMHIHMALMKAGKNIMNDAKGTLSQKAKCLIGGLCRYAPSLTAFGNMVSASYLRLVPHQEAPTKVCWSEMNRSALIRVPLGWNKVNNLASKINPQQKQLLQNIPCRQTVEIRSPDGSANAHLLLSGITLAAEWGLAHSKEALDITKRSHVTVNIHESSAYNELAEISTSCVESSEQLLQCRNMYERDGVFPPEVINFVASSLQNENDRNLNKRLLSMPEDERIKESRRIMHRDIHKS
jgi:glutamine synthetase